jgi:hypothetical protein
MESPPIASIMQQVFVDRQFQSSLYQLAEDWAQRNFTMRDLLDDQNERVRNPDIDGSKLNAFIGRDKLTWLLRHVSPPIKVALNKYLAGSVVRPDMASVDVVSAFNEYMEDLYLSGEDLADLYDDLRYTWRDSSRYASQHSPRIMDTLSQRVAARVLSTKS